MIPVKLHNSISPALLRLYKRALIDKVPVNCGMEKDGRILVVITKPGDTTDMAVILEPQ